MAGLETYFQSRTNQYGATANSVGGGQVPKGIHASPLPAVSVNFRPETKVLFSNNSTTQVSPTRQPLGWAELLPSLGRTPRVRTNTTRRRRSLGRTAVAVGTEVDPTEPNACTTFTCFGKNYTHIGPENKYEIRRGDTGSLPYTFFW